MHLATHLHGQVLHYDSNFRLISADLRVGLQDLTASMTPSTTISVMAKQVGEDIRE